MRFSRHFVGLLFVFATGCNNAGLSGGGSKAVGGEEPGKKADGPERPLGTSGTDADSASNGANTKNGTLGDGGNKASGGNLGDSDDVVSACKNKPLKTGVKLLTPTIQNGVPGNKVVYELQLLDCNGKPRPISAQFIHFDLDAEVDEHVANSYTVQVGSQTIQGTLQVVEGVDLFGKSGADFFHHKTDQAVTLTETALTATLTIDLKGQLHSPMAGDGEGGTFTAQSYLRFGDADPVAQAVTFVE